MQFVAQQGCNQRRILQGGRPRGPGPPRAEVHATCDASDGRWSRYSSFSSCTRREGRKTLNTVPCFPSFTLLRTLIVPPCLRTNSLLTHKPNPVPVVFLVVKKCLFKGPATS